MNIEKMSIEEKIAGLSEIDKAYVQGYVDRALREIKPQKAKNGGMMKEGKKNEGKEKTR